ncbi:MAG TPA: glycosyltransferase, partial [Candidatus Saccharimonadales bacterium]|nr:glycosyltransferase [Candidatus Saccharimonadales bacterium]
SIVIPVYNEADQLAACLEAIAAQTVQPLEVIIVDNNSSDDTVAVARLFPFVRILHEPRQGVVYARNCGFDAARGDIIGRIDADSRLSPDWVANVVTLFQGGALSCASGVVRYHDMSFQRLFNKVDLTLRSWLASQLENEVAMQGANMALTRAAWQQVRCDVCAVSGMHEDFDLGIHIAKAGGRLAFADTMIATVGFRQASDTFHAFCRYVMLSPQTYRQHGLRSQKYFYPVVYLALASFFFLKFAHQSYDADLESFSWRKLFDNSIKPRVNPATFVE